MSEENKTADGPAFELRDGKFFRKEDNKEIAHVVCPASEGDAPTIKGLHHTQEKFRPVLEALLEQSKDAPSVEDEQVPEIEEQAQADGEPEEEENAPFVVLSDAPPELFSKTLGDRTPEVIDWRRQNWSEEQFKAKYPTL